MRFYHCFYTDLPDQFVEANVDRLIKWVDGWDDKNRYYQRHQVIDVVGLQVNGDAKKDAWPIISDTSIIQMSSWLKSKGHLYNGQYWESLTPNQRSPVRNSSTSAGTNGISLADIDTVIYPGGITYISNRSACRSIISNLPQTSWRQLNNGMMLYGEPVTKPPLRRDTIIAGEIIGYRCWRIENNLLRSVYQSDVWQPRQILEGRELGDWDSRGIHAWKSSGSKEYHDYIRGYLNPETDTWKQAVLYGTSIRIEDKPAMLTGTVFLWGDVVEHERGYRAEYARVRSLDWLYPDADMMGKEQEVLEEFRQRYGVGK